MTAFRIYRKIARSGWWEPCHQVYDPAEITREVHAAHADTLSKVKAVTVVECPKRAPLNPTRTLPGRILQYKTA